MKTYTGTKIVNAMPMSEGIFLRDVKRVAVPLPTQMINDGYMVVYEDGYKSWSPKEVFERCYREITPAEIALSRQTQIPDMKPVD